MKPEYFTQTYKAGENDCWTLVQDIFRDEHGVDLPYYPITREEDHAKAYDHFHKNVNFERVQKAEKGCIIVFKSGRVKWHCGYALNSRQYIHRLNHKTTVTDIPAKSSIYKVLP